MRLVMVLFNAHFILSSLSLFISIFLILCFLSACSEYLFPLVFVFCRFIISNFMVSNANDNRTEKRINSHEQYAFERLWLLPLKYFRGDPFISERPCAHDGYGRSIGRCICVSRIEMKGKHRGDMAKMECSVLDMFDVYVFVFYFFKITNVFFFGLID